MNNFSKLSLDDLVDIAGETDEWFDDNFKLVDGYYRRTNQIQ